MSVPRLSVIIPTFARPDRLVACLAALAAQKPPNGGFEVLVVDDGSPTPVEQRAEALRDRLELTVLRQDNAGPAAARNAGAEAARGDLLAFTDDDCAPEPDWLFSLSVAAARHPGALLAGRTLNALPENPYAEASQQLIDYLYAYFSPASGRVPLVASNNLALPSGAFHELGGFDESFPLAAGEDRDLCARWHEAGRPTVHVPEARVLHAHAMGLAGFVKQHLAYGRGAFSYHARRSRAALRPEPLAFYCDLLRYPMQSARGVSDTVRALGLTALLGLSQVANVAGYVAERHQARRRT